MPAFPAVRIGKMSDDLPYQVKVNLPPIGTFDHCVPRTVGPELDIVVPSDNTRHLKLGIFMEEWSFLETALALLLSRLLAIELSDALLNLARLGMKNSIDLLTGLGMRKLAPPDSQTLTNLLERVGKLNGKRNTLVHGHWTLEANVIVRRGEAVLVCQYLREIKPVDPEEEEAMGDPRNQRSRVRYCFTLKRIDGTSRDTGTLRTEIEKFMSTMRFRELSWEEIALQLIWKAPYRVHYS
jgi:hypothetical protein